MYRGSRPLGLNAQFSELKCPCMSCAFLHIALSFLIVFIQSKFIFFPAASYSPHPELPPQRCIVKLQKGQSCNAPCTWQWTDGRDHPQSFPSSVPNGFMKISSEGSGRRCEFGRGQAPSGSLKRVGQQEFPEQRGSLSAVIYAYCPTVPSFFLAVQ